MYTSNITSENADYAIFFERLNSVTTSHFGIRPSARGINNDICKISEFQSDVYIRDTIVTNLLTLLYVNQSNTPVEAIFEMPLPPQGTVTDFVVEYDNNRYKSRIEDSKDAVDQYSDAISNGQQSFLVEKTNEYAFRTSIGNLPGGKVVKVTITILSRIGLSENDLHYYLHRHMLPSGTINRFKLSFDIELSKSMSSSIKSIELFNYANTYKLDINNNTNSNNNHLKNIAKLSIDESNVKIEENIILIIKTDHQTQPSIFIETNNINNNNNNNNNKTSALEISFSPDHSDIQLEDINQHSEFLFLIDVSGSMRGEPLLNAKKALTLLIRSLNTNCKFNIIAFSTSWSSAFQVPTDYNDESLKEALTFVNNLNTISSTKLLEPLEYVLGIPYCQKYPRQIFILTDGEVSNREECIRLVENKRDSLRLFTLGIGFMVDRALVSGLSYATGGRFDFIRDANEMEEKVMKLMNFAMQPHISNIEIDWNGLDIIQAPKQVRPIFFKERALIYGLVNASSSSSTSLVKWPLNGRNCIIITAYGPTGKQLRWELPVDFDNPNATGCESLHTLVSHFIIKDLEALEGQGNSNKSLIVDLAKRYSIVSKYTSLIVEADESSQIVKETMKTCPIGYISSSKMRINYSRETGRGGRGGGGRGGFTDRLTFRLLGSDDSRSKRTEVAKSIRKNKGKARLDKFYCPYPSGEKVKVSATSDENSQQDCVMTKLINLQNANGSWTSPLPIIVPSAPVELDNYPDIWKTLYVIAYFNQTFISEYIKWIHIITKATKWVKSELGNINLIDKYQTFKLHSESCAKSN